MKQGTISCYALHVYRNSVQTYVYFWIFWHEPSDMSPSSVYRIFVWELHHSSFLNCDLYYTSSKI